MTSKITYIDYLELMSERECALLEGDYNQFVLVCEKLRFKYPDRYSSLHLTQDMEIVEIQRRSTYRAGRRYVIDRISLGLLVAVIGLLIYIVYEVL